MERGEVTRLAVDPQTHVVYVEQTVYLDEGPVAKLLAVDGVTLETLQVADLSRLGAGELDVRRDNERRSDGQGWNQ